MKTITLDEEAYALLKMWQRSPDESFSKVVKKVVPAPGALGSFLKFVEVHQTDKMLGNDMLEEIVEQRPTVKRDSWNELPIQRY